MNRAAAAGITSTRRDREVAQLDDASFGAFYQRTSRPLWGYVYRVTGQAADADDIVQEAYCRLLRVELPDDELQRRKYLYRVAGNLLVDRWRRRGNEASAEALEELAAALGVGRRSVKVMLFRAKRRLRDLLVASGITARG